MMMKEFKVEASLFGKHPSSREYIHLGENSELTFSIINWVKAGYEALLKNRKKYSSDMIQHLYFLDSKTDSIVCGTLMFSRDAGGREYPLLILVQTLQMQDCKAIWSQNIDILNNTKSLDELKDALHNYKVLQIQENSLGIDTDALSVFVNKDFSKNKVFYKPLQVDDFIEIMR